MNHGIKCLWTSSVSASYVPLRFCNLSLILLTSQMNVSLSCHDAFRGNRAFEAVLAKKPMTATKAREYAEVAVKIWASCWSLIVAERKI